MNASIQLAWNPANYQKHHKPQVAAVNNEQDNETCNFCGDETQGFYCPECMEDVCQHCCTNGPEQLCEICCPDEEE